MSASAAVWCIATGKNGGKLGNPAAEMPTLAVVCGCLPGCGLGVNPASTRGVKAVVRGDDGGEAAWCNSRGPGG